MCYKKIKTHLHKKGDCFKKSTQLDITIYNFLNLTVQLKKFIKNQFRMLFF